MLARRRIAFEALLGLAVFLLVVGAAFRTPGLPATGTEGSWMLALGVAVHNHLAFGRDVFYTYGPLGYLEVPGIVPFTYTAKTLFALSIACATSLLVLLRARSEGSPWHRIAFVTGAVIIFPYTSLLYYAGEGDVQIFLLLPLLFTFPAFTRGKPVRLLALFLGFLAGFISLIKVSLCVVALIVGIGTLLVRAVTHGKWSAMRYADIEATVLYVVGFCVSSAGIYYWVTYGFNFETALAIVGTAVALCWIARSNGKAPFPVAPIPVTVYIFLATLCSAALVASAPYREFLYYSLQVAAGYTSAVSLDAQSNAMLLGLLLLGMAAFYAIREKKTLGATRLFAVLAILFLAFRQDFVRQDDTHMMPYFLTVSLLACVVLLSATQPRSAIYAAFLVVLSLSILPIFNPYWRTVARKVTFPLSVASGLSSAVQTVAGWRRNFETLAATYKLGLAPDALAPPLRRHLGTEPADLVGTETNIVFANGLKWRPRPAFHAPYSVFTASLDALNADSVHSGKTGRELLTYETVDGRYPFGDEPKTTRELVCNYTTDGSFPQPVETQGGTDIAVLRRTSPRCGSAVLRRLGTVAWNEPLSVIAPTGQLSFLFVDFRYGLRGKALRFLYQIPPVYMAVHYQSGSIVKYRILPELLGSGLLVNPIPRDVGDVIALFAGRNADPVSAVQFTSHGAWLFSPRIAYQLRDVPYGRVRQRVGSGFPSTRN